MLTWGIKKNQTKPQDKALKTVLKFSPKGINNLALTLGY